MYRYCELHLVRLSLYLECIILIFKASRYRLILLFLPQNISTGGNFKGKEYVII